MSGFLLNLKRRKIELGSANKASRKVFINASDEESDSALRPVPIGLFDSKIDLGLGERDMRKRIVIKPAKLFNTIPQRQKLNDAIAESVTKSSEGALQLRYGLTTFDKNHDAMSDKIPKTDPKNNKYSLCNESNDFNGEFSDIIVSKYNTMSTNLSSLNNLESRNSDDEDQYSRVPVADFGAALLRGMGWKPLSSDKNVTIPIKRRQLGPTLGIGATAIETEIMEELNGAHGENIRVPLLRRNRDTGKIMKFSATNSNILT